MFTLSGVNTTDAKGYSLNAEPGSFILTGINTTDLRALIVNAVAGSFVLSGINTTDIRDLLINAEAGSFSLSGFATTDLRALLLNAEPGSFALTLINTTDVFDAGGGGGSVITFFRGISKAPSFKGVSKITLRLTDAGGGTYTVTRISGVADETDNIQSSETHLIDGEPV